MIKHTDGNFSMTPDEAIELGLKLITYGRDANISNLVKDERIHTVPCFVEMENRSPTFGVGKVNFHIIK